ncbi:hypothetical protein HJ526_15650 [Donghicola sp. C2-DW-16]|uniref:ATP synthase subunit b n=1 Tax=Donghicola mangrovi TaxID=2729614 RepID=A0ABX2PK20_9RHOB|nr:F0F1 ATP synthase subunit delta [Donghicola mangrovi]NVO28864.1 hypothetical protein [Donghicola mangrovi]
MTIDWWTLGLQTVNALVLIWLLGRYLFGPVSAIIAERRAAAQADLDKAAAELESARAAHAAAEATRDDVTRQRADMLAAAQTEAEAERTRLLAAAADEAAETRARTQSQIAQMHQTARAEISAEAAKLAANIARKALARLPDDILVAPFAEGLADAISALPELARDRIGQDGPVTLRTARALTAPEETVIRQALSRALGRDIALTLIADASLIAGLELDAPTATVRNHLAADLTRIEAELAAHD